MFRKCDEVEMTHAKASTMSDSELDRLLYPQAHLTHIKIADPDFAAIQSELLQHPNLNLKFLWDEYASAQKERFRTRNSANATSVGARTAEKN
jgi:hypothetical protein